MPGACVLPGLADAHLHLGAYGLQLEQLDLTGVGSLAEVVALVAARADALPCDAWLLGGGWDHTLWPEPHLPDRHALDAVTGDRPVALARKDRHITWVNSAALRRAGIGRGTPPPAGGVIDREADGAPSGILRESSQRLVETAIGDPPPEMLRGAVRRAQTALLKLGITCVHAPDTPATFAALQDLAATGELRLRVVYMPPAATLEQLVARRMAAGWGDGRLRIGHLKCFLDGSLGSHTAAMLAPFEDEPGNTGVVITPPEALADLLRCAADSGFGVAMHAIGDRANRQALDTITGADLPADDPLRRPRIEHVQVLHPDDIPRLAALGVVASMQPIHTTQDMDNADRFWALAAVAPMRSAACCEPGQSWRSVRCAGGDAGPVGRAVCGGHTAAARRHAGRWLVPGGAHLARGGSASLYGRCGLRGRAGAWARNAPAPRRGRRHDHRAGHLRPAAARAIRGAYKPHDHRR